MNNEKVDHPVLTQAEAQERARWLGSVKYHLHLKIPRQGETFSGVMEIDFEKRAEPLVSGEAESEPHQAEPARFFVDFFQGEVQALKVNQVARKVHGGGLKNQDGEPAGDHDLLQVASYQGVRILIPSAFLKVGRNHLEITFTQNFSNQGVGFQRTVDQQDGQVYFYTNSEPFNANRSFPLFDQPDLKARYEVTVDADPSWQVIGNTKADDDHAPSATAEPSVLTDSQGDLYRRWHFPAKKVFSTYLFALVVGPYHRWDSVYERELTGEKVPLSLYARKSMVSYLEKDVQNWFKITQEGFRFFEKSFGQPYPFEKYDQILCPDYNMGAMENVGAVTFNESYIFRSDPTLLQIYHRATTITHELAHMWFGNLVTLRWWDDLWLNESFATVYSNLANSYFPTAIDPRISERDVWQFFNAQEKNWGYHEDDEITTHPIVGQAKDTLEADAIFDGLTYGKGAAVLKQLIFVIGEQALVKGLQSYFQKFRFLNATRHDFLASLGAAAGIDLKAWDESWLKTQGTNAVQVLTKSNPDGTIAELVLEQFASELDDTQTLRSHKTLLGFYDLTPAGELKLRQVLPVVYQGAKTTVPAAQGLVKPAFLFPNVDDHDFVRVILDRESLATLHSHLGKIQDPFLRQVLWETLWKMVEHAQLSAQEFCELIFKHLAEEKNLSAFRSALALLRGTAWWMSPEIKLAYRLRKEEFLYQNFLKAESKSDFQIILFREFVAHTRSKPGLSRLKHYLQQTEIEGAGFLMDQERRWHMLQVLARAGEVGIEDIERERAQDQNDKGLLSAWVAEVLLPDEKGKKRWWKRFLNQDPGLERLNTARARSLMGSFHKEDQPELTAFMRASFFEMIPKLIDQFHDGDYAKHFVIELFPLECSDALNQELKTYIEQHPQLEFGLKKELRRILQNRERTTLARALSHQVGELKR